MLFFKEDQQYIKDNNNGNINNKSCFIKIGLLLFMIVKLYILLCNDKYFLYKKELYFYKTYILDCQKLKLISFENENLYNFSYFSIVLPVYNTKKYIGSSIFSIINQSYREFEIIIINDLSNDGTQNIIQKFQSQFSKIKIINHSSNLGIYISRVEGVLNSIGNYIIFIDSDDILLNPFLFQKLYEFNAYYNLDIIEFVVLHKEEGKNNLFLPTDHKLNHFHNYSKNII